MFPLNYLVKRKWNKSPGNLLATLAGYHLGNVLWYLYTLCQGKNWFHLDCVLIVGEGAYLLLNSPLWTERKCERPICPGPGLRFRLGFLGPGRYSNSLCVILVTCIHECVLHWCMSNSFTTASAWLYGQTMVHFWDMITTYPMTL
jgi:hypothetical protein